jgi:putative peptide zinc metalloprotease protein
MTTATRNPPAPNVAVQRAVSGLERPLALRRRTDVTAVPQTFSGQRVWAVKDPVALRYFHFRDEEFWVFQALDGRTGLAEIQRQFERHFAPRRLAIPEIQSFLGVLHEEGLVLADAPGQTGEILERGRVRRRQKLLAALSNVLAIRFRGVDPQRFLDFLLNRFQWFFSRRALIVCAGIVAAALLLVLSRFDTVLARIPEFNSFLTPATLIWLTLALALVKILHELGHALTCRYCGAECHELGFMLLVFTPCLYCNVSDSWMLESKWRRAAVGAGGVCVELVLAGAATLVWWFSEPGLLNSLCLNIMLVCSVSTLVFNGNPLLRYDGYYILSDVVEVPNLSQTASATLGGALAGWLLGIPPSHHDEYSPAKRAFLGTYAVLSAIYRIFITLAIVWFLHGLLKPWHLELLALIAAIVVVAAMTAVPVWRAVRFLQYAHWSRQMQLRRALTAGFIAAALLGVVLLTPLPHRIGAPVVLEAENARHIYVPVAGTLVEGLNAGSTVEAGQPVAVLQNPELQLEVARLRGQRDEQKLRLQNLRHRQTTDSEAAAQIPTAEEALADLEERLAKRLEDEKRLVVAAPCSGTVLPGRRKIRKYADNELESWSGLPLDPENRGCFLETGTLLCQIGDPEKFEASMMLDQGDMEFIRPGQKVWIQLDQRPDKLLSGTIREIAEIDLKITPAELLPAGTLPTRPDETGVYRPVGTVYQARVALQPSDIPLIIGEPGSAKVHAASMSLARRISRYLSSTFRFEL